MEIQKRVLNAAESSKLVEKYVLAPKSQVVQRFEEIKFQAPLALKILSKDAIHKTEVNGVKIVMYPDSVKSAFDSLLEEARKHNLELDGVFVQEFVRGIETIAGIKKDPVFGHMILFGLGGIFTEAIADTSTRKCPITKKDAEEMIEELRSSKIFLEGFRGMKVNLDNLEKSLVEISKLPEKYKDVEELDINPFTLTDEGGFAVDARVVMG